MYSAGEDGSGKTTLMAKLEGAEHNKKGRGLEYLYLSVHDEDRDGEFNSSCLSVYVCFWLTICFCLSCVDLTRCNVWILDGDLYHKGLLKFAVSAKSLTDCLAVFVVDMSRPWIIMDSLQKWSSVLRDHVDKLKIEPDVMREMEQKSESWFICWITWVCKSVESFKNATGEEGVTIERQQCAPLHICMNDSRSSSDDPQLCSLTGGCFCRSVGVLNSGVILWLILVLVFFFHLWIVLCLERLLHFFVQPPFFAHEVLQSVTSAAATILKLHVWLNKMV